MNQVYKISDKDKKTLKKRLTESGTPSVEDAINIFETWYASHMSARKRFQINK